MKNRGEAYRQWCDPTLHHQTHEETLDNGARPDIDSRVMRRGIQPGSIAVFFFQPRRFMTHRQTCRMISAQACACHPHIPQSTLLAMKQQKPSLRLPGRLEPMHQAASTVRTMAGHSRKSIQSFITRYPN